MVAPEHQNIAERISEATMGAAGARDRGKKKADRFCLFSGGQIISSEAAMGGGARSALFGVAMS